jgi:hypothetical protein
MTFIDLTKSAGTGAGRAHQQKSSGFLGIALSPIGAAPFFTNCVNLSLLNNLLHC